jgi:N-formylglutamate amidohydrolase
MVVDADRLMRRRFLRRSLPVMQKNEYSSEDSPSGEAWRIARKGANHLPVVAAAIHDGHQVRPEVASRLALSEPERLREEDPFTARWTDIVPIRVIGCRSRFEVDLNRPREKAVYRVPADAWGLTVWNETPLSEEIVKRSLAIYDAFYADVQALLKDLEARHGAFVVLDLHTYNHRRDGPQAAPAAPDQNPEVNIGTGTLLRPELWSPLIARFMSDLRRFDFQGRQLDVRENVKFKGGQFGRWIHQTFPETACALSVEFKKFFMDEWTGIPDPAQLTTIREALVSTLPGLCESLARITERGRP